MAEFTRSGYGQVEPNQLSALKTGQIYASLPLDSSVEVLQQGEFMYYDYISGKVTGTPSNDALEPFLVYQETKLYVDYLTYKDFAMIKVGDSYVTHAPVTNFDNYVFGSTAVNSDYRLDGYAPRLFKTNVGDIMTTNMVPTGVEYSVGDILTPTAVTNTGASGSYKTLVLTKDNTATSNAWAVVKVYTMPDGQPGLKLQRIA